MRFSDKRIIASQHISKEVAIEGLRECVASNAAIQSNKKYSSTGRSFAIHYSLDAQGRVFALITVPNYSARIAFAALEDLQQLFNKEFGMKAATAKEDALSKPAQNVFNFIYQK